MPTIEDKVSVVLPVHHVNREWLTQSIRSVLEQEYESLELIVVNDETTEDIDELVRSLGVHKYVKNDRNWKLPYSLNRGFESADGEFHTWTSADNYMLPGMISRLVKEIKARPEVQIVCGKSFVMNEAGTLLSLAETDAVEGRALKRAGTSFADPLLPRRRLFYGSLGACFLYHCSVWDALKGYDENLHGAEDFDFWLRASRHFKVGRISSTEPPYYVYRIHSTSMSNTVIGCFSTLRVAVLEREAALYPEDKHLAQALAVQRRQSQRNKGALGKLLSNVRSQGGRIAGKVLRGRP
jgi:glycosyltransferase involved in cell wall biosynthesis